MHHASIFPSTRRLSLAQDRRTGQPRRRCSPLSHCSHDRFYPSFTSPSSLHDPFFIFPSTVQLSPFALELSLIRPLGIVPYDTVLARLVYRYTLRLRARLWVFCYCTRSLLHTVTRLLIVPLSLPFF